jgi:hypothetical protein
MRFCHITNYYQQFIRRFEARRPDLRRTSYSEQHDAIVRERYGWSDHLVRNLTELGHEAALFIANHEGAQTEWAAERGLGRDRHADSDVVLEQLKAFRPDVVFFEDSLSFSAEFARDLRRRVPSIRALVAYVGIPRTDIALLAETDLIVTNGDHLSERMRAGGRHAVTMLHAFETSVLATLARRRDRIDVSFAGSFMPGFHDKRYDLLRSLLRAGVPLDVYTDLFQMSALDLLKYLARASTSSPGAIRRLWGPLRACSRPAVYGESMLEVIFNSAISLNSHSDADIVAGNMRLFEVTGCGACLVTDWMPNVGKLFEVGTEVITYRSSEECVEIVKWLLEHESERATIARAGQRRTLRDHTFRARCEELATAIDDSLHLRPHTQVNSSSGSVATRVGDAPMTVAG